MMTQFTDAYMRQYFIEMCSLWRKLWYVNIGYDDDLAPLSDPMMTQFTDAYMRHPASMS